MKSPSPLFITPPPENPDEADRKALDVIRQLDKIMARKSTIKTLNHRICIRDDSVRRIQGGRYEIFVSDATDKQSTCFDQIVKRDQSWLPLQTKDILIDFAIRQAKRNPDIARYGDSYTFGNFSLLVNGQKAEKQPNHIDMNPPNSQFGLMLTSNSPATLVYHVNETIKTAHDVKRVWNEWNGPKLVFPDNLMTAFESSSEANLLLQEFGNILIPEDSMMEQRVEHDVPPGSLMTLPGGVIHAGPQCKQGRTVLFFSGCPKEVTQNGQQQYHPDTQYSALFVCGQLISVLWRSPGVGRLERDYLLRMLVKYQRQSTIERKLACHFPEGAVKAFVMQLEDNKDLLGKRKLEKYIKDTAQDEEFCLFNINGDFQQVSVRGLLTKWEGIEMNLVVYRREFDNKILLNYPNEIEGSWEGGNPGDAYSLILNENETLPFDGTNGKLVDNDGEVIRCYTRGKKKPKKQRVE
jgi:hypothetical protein